MANSDVLIDIKEMEREMRKLIPDLILCECI